jgi:aminobenzoyl-glutamate utilization protein B
MEANRVSGTLRYYGTPAEEGGSGKVFMVRAGLFKDDDVVLHWHPGDHNSVNNAAQKIAGPSRQENLPIPI